MKTTSIKAVLILGLAICLSPKTIAQKNETTGSSDFTNAIGLRFGGTSGLDFKHKFSSNNALELILGTYPDAFGITALYERNVTTQVSGLNLYFGGGAHISRVYARSYRYFYNDRYYYYNNYGSGTIMGIDGIAGIEYKIPRVPLALSLDVKPMAEFYSGYGPYFNLDPGLGIKFTF